jgi:hypothetical protein
MKHEGLYYLAAAALCAAWILTPGPAHAAKDYNLSVSFNNAESCADLKVTSNNGQIAQTAEMFNLRKSDAPVLEVNDQAGRAVIHVRGWDRGDYTVEACKVAVAGDRGTAEQLVRGISVSRAAGRFSSSGPNTSQDSGQWQLYYIMHAPKDASLDLETKNGPISVAGMAGNVKARATNGPVSLSDCSGQVDAHTANGPIALNGGGGDVRLVAQNGPISVNLTGDQWIGPKLDARTVNGPVSVNVPDSFRSGIRLETGGHAPLSCAIESCRSAFTDARSDQKVLQLNGSQDTIRISTENGPVSVGGKGKGRRVL